MKKIISVLFFLALALVCFVPKTTVFAEENLTFEVVSNSCVVYQLETGKTFQTINSLQELIELKKLNFGESVLKVEETVFEFKNINNQTLKFLKVKTSDEIIGYVLASCVAVEEKSLEVKLDANAKIAVEKAYVFSSNEKGNENKLIINGEEVFLKQGEEIKIVDGYDKGKEFCEVMFEFNNEIKTGFVKTSDVKVKGFNGTIILIIFIFILLASTIWAIYSATRKKRKKANKK